MALALAMVPSLAFLDAAGQYLRFVLQWDPGTIPMTHTSYPVPHAPSDTIEPRFVQFALKAPKAKHVLLAGDFNDWQPEEMSKSKGKWSLLLPLPPGRYEYSFQVDGSWMTDPAQKETSVRGQMKTSIRQVQ